LVEPTRAIPLRFGSYEARYLLGLIYIVAGALLIAATNTYAIQLLLAGTVAHIGGWYVLPGPGARRAWMAWPSLISCFLLLAGPQYVVVMTIPLLAWLVVRQRPALSYLALLVPLVVGRVAAEVFVAQEDLVVATAVEVAAVVVAAWVARAIAVGVAAARSRNATKVVDTPR
jgi:hypothetical protein